MLWRALPADEREFIVGDLDEEYARHRAPHGARRARRWYWSQAVRSIAHASRKESPMPATPMRVSTRMFSLVAAVPGDVRFALRSLRRSPGYASAALLTFALGVGASIAIFSTVNDVVLRPLPYPESDRLVMLWESNQERGWQRVEAAPANVDDWRARAETLDDIAFVNPFPQTLSLMTAGGPVPADVAQVSGSLFAVLGVPPLLGRVFHEGETFEPDIAVLSHATWRLHFGADGSVVGRAVQLDGRSYQVLGVMGPEFEYPLGDIDVWTTPAAMAPRRESIWWRQAHVVKPIGRLAAGATLAQASAELTAIAADLEREYPDTNTGMEAGLTPLKTFLAGDRRVTLLLLLAAVGVLQLIACANVANLMLGRALGRRQELAVRSALGAERGRLVRQTLTESLVLAAGGTALGLALGVAALQLIASLAPPELGGLGFRVDWRMALFAAGLCLASAVLTGALPAWRSARVDAARHLADAARSGTAGRRHLAAANGFVAFEVGLAVLLAAAAGLMVRSLDQLRRIEPGIDATSVLTFQVHPTRGTFPTDAARAAFGIAFARELQAIPGVEIAGVGRGLPLTGYSWSSDFTIDDWETGRYGIEVRHREATGEYFSALRVPILDGRAFDERDLAPGAPVPVVVNRAFADRYFPDVSPVGRRVVFDREPTERSTWYPIVGVVGNERKDLLTEPVPEIIAHLRGDVPATLTFVVRTGVPPLSVVPQVRAALDGFDRATPLLSVRTMAQVVADSRVTERFLLSLFGSFALAALALAAIGVHGVAAQAARARTREVGIRLALGASAASVVRQLVQRGAAFLLAGLAAGLAGALFAGRFLDAYLYHVDPRDPLTLTVVSILMALVALAATIWPTWRATKVDPASVLRP
jgi:putative ABC transport system permease protein